MFGCPLKLIFTVTLKYNIHDYDILWLVSKPSEMT
jgi:hypothetical protein